jgi:hypothetical protein
MAMTQGVYSYGHVKTLTEQLMEDALALLDAPNAQANLPLTQSHALIRAGVDYADLFALGAQQNATAAWAESVIQTATQNQTEVTLCQ